MRVIKILSKCNKELPAINDIKHYHPNPTPEQILKDIKEDKGITSLHPPIPSKKGVRETLI